MGEQLTLFSTVRSGENEIFEYLFVISPNDRVKKNVRELKFKLHNQIGLESFNLQSLAHISLVEFKSGLEESRILEKSTMALKNMTKFSVNVNGHFVFAHGATRSLVLQLQEEKHIEGMANLLRTEFYEKIASKKPHLTIARSIPVKSFETIADDLSSYNYEDEFLCSSVTILRKPIGVNKRYSKMHEIHFDN